MATDRRYSSAYDRLQSQGTVSMFGNTPVSKLPEYYKAENQQKTPISTSLYEAAKEGNLVKIQECLSEGGNPNWFNHDDEGATALFAACIGGHLEAARALVAGGAAVEPRLLTSKDTVLHMCCAHNRLEILQFLVEGPAADMVDAENTFGNTPLHVACMGSNPDMVRFLLQHGASSRRANKRGSSALHFAAYSPGGAAALAALVGAVFVGARTGRFNYDGTANEMNEQNPVIQTLGTIFMWFGWFGFNGASARTLTGHGGSVARSMAMTALCPSTCAITAVLLGMWRKGFIDQKLANNGILAGCVAISAGCATVRGEGAFVIGVLAAPTFYFAQELLLRLKLDDVVNAIPVHLAAGVLGTVLTGFFAHPDNYERAYGASGERARRCAGVLYGGAGYGLAANLVALLAQLAWVGSMSALCYWSIGKLVGLRVSREMEEVGMDRSKHGGIIGQEEHYNPGDTDHIQNFLNVFMTRKVAKSEKS
mmetsp:Transcript_10371/g.17140  ORF Transcript_10371/g.17140 Transcript_10371/m.17140 type:complete len:481 (+) Transcript_10371:79-1521(+)